MPQGSALPIYLTSKSLEFPELLKLPRTAIELDWFGAPSPAALSFALAVDRERLFFAVECRQAPACDLEASCGEFRAELWKQDVAELFLKEDGSERYQEFNLSPAGAWWSALFRGRRQPAMESFPPPEGVQTFSRIDASAWKAALSIPRASLSVAFGFSHDSRANVSSIIDGRERRHFSWARIPSEKPDFHRVQDFCALAPQA
jgi:hypothetical protein